jgi:Fe-S cluster assembly ATPase SufC
VKEVNKEIIGGTTCCIRVKTEGWHRPSYVVLDEGDSLIEIEKEDIGKMIKYLKNCQKMFNNREVK